MIRVRVPATSANLGPGFDALGLAVGLYLEVVAEPAASDSFHYQGVGALPDTPDNLVHEGFRAAFAEAGAAPPPVAIRAANPIPLARGLGSSSAALVAGAALADATLEHALGRDGVFQLCARLEGHPDNVAPAVYGGFTVSAQLANGNFLCESLALPESWQLLFGVPDFELLTSRARAVLPEAYARSEAIFNLSRTALWGLAVAQDKPDLLRAATQDALHEPYREPLIPGLSACRKALLKAGAYAAFLSGAGPTVGVVCSAPAVNACRTILDGFVGAGAVLQLASAGGYSFPRQR